MPVSLLSFRPRNKREDNLPIVCGMVPDNWLFDRLRAKRLRDNWPIVDGIVPINLLSPRYRLLREVSWPIVDGIVPISSLSPRFRLLREVSWPIVDGIVPLKRLLDKLKMLTLLPLSHSTPKKLHEFELGSENSHPWFAIQLGPSVDSYKSWSACRSKGGIGIVSATLISNDITSWAVSFGLSRRDRLRVDETALVAISIETALVAISRPLDNELPMRSSW